MEILHSCTKPSIWCLTFVNFAVVWSRWAGWTWFNNTDIGRARAKLLYVFRYTSACQTQHSNNEGPNKFVRVLTQKINTNLILGSPLCPQVKFHKSGGFTGVWGPSRRVPKSHVYHILWYTPTFNYCVIINRKNKIRLPSSLLILGSVLQNRRIVRHISIRFAATAAGIATSMIRSLNTGRYEPYLETCWVTSGYCVRHYLAYVAAHPQPSYGQRWLCYCRHKM